MKLKLIAALFAVITMSACTENSRAKGWGGTATVEVATDRKVVSATWKGEQLWYLTRPMQEGETAESVHLVEESSFGVVEGKVIFKESKSKDK